MVSAGNKPIVIMAGGTGGHIYPALAVALRLRELGVPLLWLGSRCGMENRIVPQTGITLVSIAVSGLRGRSLLTLLSAPFKLMLALVHALLLLAHARPAAVLGMGGFATGPGGVAAWLLRVPLLLHEQNAILGLTNRWLAPIAVRLMEAFPGTFASARAAHTGNPVRAEIIAIAPRAERMKRHPVGKRLLVLGGSQGARALNEAVPNALALLAQEAGKHKGAMNEEMQSVHAIEVWHQTGADKLNDTRAAYQRAGIGARVVPYIEHMHEAYAWADLVVCRAGAMTIAELSAVGLASILVPYPHAVDDHQTANARYLTAIGAAELMPECNLDNAGLAALLGELLSDPGRLQRMAEAARAAGQPRASELVAAICMEVAYA